MTLMFVPHAWVRAMRKHGWVVVVDLGLHRSVMMEKVAHEARP